MVTRRRFLRSLLLLPLALQWRPGPVWAMGGILPELNQPVPAFELPGVIPGADAQTGFIETKLALGDFEGRWLTLYFYPKDFTSGCTLEARGFQKDLEGFRNHQAEVVGISADDSEAHISFCGSEGLVPNPPYVGGSCRWAL